LIVHIYKQKGSAPSTHIRPAGKTVVLGSDSSIISALIAHSALGTKLKSWSSSITKDEHHQQYVAKC